MTLVIGSLQLGFLYGILALGIYVTFRILNIPDLTAEGSFTLGLAASAVCTLAGHPVAGIRSPVSCVLPPIFKFVCNYSANFHNQ